MKIIEYEDLIKIYLAICRQVPPEQLKVSFQAIGFDFLRIKGCSDKETILNCLRFLYRRDRVYELVDILSQSNVLVDWEEQLEPIKLESKVIHKAESNIYKILSDHFTVDELRELCFFLNIDHEDLPDVWVKNEVDLSVESIQKYLVNENIQFDTLQIDEINRILRLSWAHEFYEYYKKRRLNNDRLWNYIVYMKPNLFENE
ncbi:MAG: hypothetical protein AAF902_17270 [Chloroflexota bacterium]